MASDFKSNLKGNISGGLTAMTVSLPLSLALGVTAFAPLGGEYLAQGALAGLYSAVFAGIFASVFGGTPAQITAPTAPMGVLVASTVTSFLRANALEGQGQFESIIALVMLTVVLGGVFQTCLGILGGEKLVKFVPYPVTAGCVNGAAIIILKWQINPILGLETTTAFSPFSIPSYPISFVSLAVGGLTIAGIALAPRLTPRIPALLTGLVTGITTYFAVAILFDQSLLLSAENHLILGPVPKDIPTPRGFLSLMELTAKIVAPNLNLILMASAALGFLGAMSSLSASVMADAMTKTRHDSQRELIGQGIGNIISGFFNGIGAAGNPASSAMNIESGGRTRFAAVIHGLAILLVILLLWPAAQWLPVSALAGILVMTALRMIDYKSLGLVKTKTSRVDFLIVLVVTGTSALMGLLTAVGIGILITILIFVQRLTSRTIIRRKYHGDSVGSKKMRLPRERSLLEDCGRQIVVYELEGSLFFGTYDQLMNEMEPDRATSRYIILDFKRVYSIDITAMQLLRQLAVHLREDDKHLLIGYLDSRFDPRRIWKELKDASVIDEIGTNKVFPETDLALEWAEDDVLSQQSVGIRQKEQEVGIAKMEIFREFGHDALQLIVPFVQTSSYSQGQIIFKEGDEGNTMYLISSGSVSIRLQVNETARSKRITSFGAGSFFGEMAFLEGELRSAVARAETDTTLISLTNDDFVRFKEKHPDLATKMILSMLKEVSARLRITSQEVRVLE